jgi:predicted amidohydrolase
MIKMRIAAIACTGEGGMDESLSRAKNLVIEACCQKPDLICFPEIFAWSSLPPARQGDAAEPIDGPYCRAMAGLAAEHKVNILAPLVEEADGHIYNTMLWINRDGHVAGQYRKVYPTLGEMERGFRPGPLQFDVFETEFGPIGCCICFDLNFPEVIHRIAEQKAPLVLFPTMFDGTLLMQSWAKLFHMYFVSVAGYPYGALVDPLGKVLIEPWKHPAIMIADVNLDFVALHTDGNREKFINVKREYKDLAHIDCHDIASSALLSSFHPDHSARDMAAEFDLELEVDYYSRSRDQRQRLL